ncbi:MAG: TatD family hydrolase [Acidimicrobiaceae bacterium]|nr:TatD family hydrolase [Acidimicrobiaceae bacterium]
MAWADHHCHLPVEVDDSNALIEDAYQAGVRLLINVATSVDNSCRIMETVSVDTVSAHAGMSVWATAGVHPHSASAGVDGLEFLLEHPKVIAVGEAGLDYHYDHSPRKTQRSVFAAQIEMANRHELPLVVHSRSAWDDVFGIFDYEGIPERTVMHCFTGGVDELRECIKRSALVSFSGIITFANADKVRDAVEVCPLEKLLVETDSPYLTPVPHRGQPNRPALVTLVGEETAKIKSITVDEVENATWKTALKFYGVEDFYTTSG